MKEEPTIKIITQDGDLYAFDIDTLCISRGFCGGYSYVEVSDEECCSMVVAIYASEEAALKAVQNVVCPEKKGDTGPFVMPKCTHKV